VPKKEVKAKTVEKASKKASPEKVSDDEEMSDASSIKPIAKKDTK